MFTEKQGRKTGDNGDKNPGSKLPGLIEYGANLGHSILAVSGCSQRH